MPLTDKARQVIERPLPPEKIKQRPGGKGMVFDYVSPDFVISLLNEAFDYHWDTRIVSHTMHNDTALVCLELTVFDAKTNTTITKQQFGSCDVNRGMGYGEAFKGAASDALKKAATLLGVALELYQDDDATTPQFKRPEVPSAPPTPPVAPRNPTPPAAPRNPTTPAVAAPVPSAPPAPVAAPVSPPVPPSPKEVGGGQAPPKPVNPFAENKPVAVAPPKPNGVSVPKVNPFAKKLDTAGPNATQISALTNLASRKDKTQRDLIALAGIADVTGNPKQSFEDLTHSEAIEVIKASQL